MYDYNVFVSGLSNSVFKEGYVKGIKDSTRGRVDNISLGASNIGLVLWLLKTYRSQMKACDIVLLDYYIMDYQTDIALIRRDLRTSLRKVSEISLPVVLLWPDKLTMTAPNQAAIDAYHEICDQENVLMIDCRDLVHGVMQSQNIPSLDAMFQDTAHIHPHLAYDIGVDIAGLLHEYLESVVGPEQVYVQTMAVPGMYKVGPPWLLVEVGTVYEFVAEKAGAVIGLMILTKQADFTVHIKDQSRRVTTYWAPNDPNPPQILRFITLGSVPVEAGESVTITTTSKDELIDAIAINSVLLQLV